MGLWGRVSLMVREDLAKVTSESCRRGSSWLGKEQSRWPAPRLKVPRQGWIRRGMRTRAARLGREAERGPAVDVGEPRGRAPLPVPRRVLCRCRAAGLGEGEASELLAGPYPHATAAIPAGLDPSSGDPVPRPC